MGVEEINGHRFWRLASGRVLSHFECEEQLSRATTTYRRWCHRVLETVPRWPDNSDMAKWEIDRLRLKLDDLGYYLEAAHQALDEMEGRNRRQERITALRNVEGRTPEEAAAFLAKADALEG